MHMKPTCIGYQKKKPHVYKIKIDPRDALNNMFYLRIDFNNLMGLDL